MCGAAATLEAAAAHHSLRGHWEEAWVEVLRVRFSQDTPGARPLRCLRRLHAPRTAGGEGSCGESLVEGVLIPDRQNVCNRMGSARGP